MAKFRKKPVVIDAIKYEGHNLDAIRRFLGRNVEPLFSTMELPILTLEGMMLARSGDWIIKGIKGEFYPIKDDIFEATYVPVKAELEVDWQAGEIQIIATVRNHILRGHDQNGELAAALRSWEAAKGKEPTSGTSFPNLIAGSVEEGMFIDPDDDDDDDDVGGEPR